MLVKGPWTWDKRPPEDTMTKKMLVLSPMDLGVKTPRKHKDKKKCWKKAQWTQDIKQLKDTHKNEIIGRRLDGLKIEVKKIPKDRKTKETISKDI